MWRSVPDSIDRFPGDFMTSLRSAAVAAPACWVRLIWWLARSYMQRTYPGHAGDFSRQLSLWAVLDGLLLGVADLCRDVRRAGFGGTSAVCDREAMRRFGGSWRALTLSGDGTLNRSREDDGNADYGSADTRRPRLSV